jgi:polyadenylate-binding protein
MFSNRDPMLRNNGQANVFIKNLEPSIDNKGLNDLFSSFGKILSCKVATDLNGHSKGYGFVQFEDEKSATDAINVMNGMLSNGRMLFVCLFIRRQDRQHICGVSRFTNVYVRNFSEKFNEDDLHQLFAPFREITSAVVIKDFDGKSRCFGFVNYMKAECAIEAIKNLNGKMVKDMLLYVGRAQKKAERQAELRAKFMRDRSERVKKFEGLNLYIKNLDNNIDNVHIRNLFENFGEIASCKVMSICLMAGIFIS